MSSVLTEACTSDLIGSVFHCMSYHLPWGARGRVNVAPRLRREELLHLVVALRHLLLQGRSSRSFPGLLIRRVLLGLHQLRLL